VQLWDAVQRGDHAASLDLHKRLLHLWNALFGDNLPANVKFAMELQSRRGGFPRAPMAGSSEEQQASIRAGLNECLGFSAARG
jgi:4-hydroxy-tetrahydrodipicolinate synthase